MYRERTATQTRRRVQSTYDIASLLQSSTSMSPKAISVPSSPCRASRSWPVLVASTIARTRTDCGLSKTGSPC